MKDKTLREICEAFGVTRRAVQGYEKAGLLVASGKNKRGYLLYDEECQQRIQRIKLYQQMGFKVREIKKLLDASKSDLKEALENQVQKLVDFKNVYLYFTIYTHPERWSKNTREWSYVEEEWLNPKQKKEIKKEAVAS